MWLTRFIAIFAQPWISNIVPKTRYSSWIALLTAAGLNEMKYRCPLEYAHRLRKSHRKFTPWSQTVRTVAKRLQIQLWCNPDTLQHIEKYPIEMTAWLRKKLQSVPSMLFAWHCVFLYQRIIKFIPELYICGMYLSVTFSQCKFMMTLTLQLLYDDVHTMHISHR